MPRNLTVYSCLLSSPRGLEQDRISVHDAMREVNTHLSLDGIQVDVLDWERDVRPTIGLDGQQVVNEQICYTSDFALVLISDRVGSPTPRHQSGTIEEAEIFLKRKAAGEAVDLFVLFRKPSIELTRTALEELGRVLEFRDSLSSRGVFWKEYVDEGHLAELIRLHIPGTVRSIRSSVSDVVRDNTSLEIRANQENIFAQQGVAAEVEFEVELGSLDYEIALLEALDQNTKLVTSLGEAAVMASERMQHETRRFENIKLDTVRNPKKIRDVINDSVQLLDDYSGVAEPIAPKLRQNLEDIVRSMIGLVSLSDSALHEEPADLDRLIEAVRENRRISAEAVQSSDGWRAALLSWPRMTKELNRARRRCTLVQEEISDAMSEYVVKMGDVESAIISRMNNG